MATAINPATAKVLIWSTRYAGGFIWRVVGITLGSDVACRLPTSTTMGHPYGIVAHSRAMIGEGVTIMQNVTIGAKTIQGEAPTVGDGVYIGAGAILLGPIHIGEGSVIGAGSVVVKDVPPWTVVAGNPAKAIGTKAPKRSGETEPYGHQS